MTTTAEPNTQNMTAAPVQAAPGAGRTAALYVGDLHGDITEPDLYQLFNPVAQVQTCKVCRHAITRQSLGYAYVNFHTVADAERAMEVLNYSELKGRPIRIMWSQRDPSLRRSGVGNVFVKNLPPDFQSKDLHDVFSMYGNILSCKVPFDYDKNVSKGYGFVQFEKADDAQKAIDDLDGKEINEYKVTVTRYVQRAHRPGKNLWTNLYIKNVPKEYGEEKLQELFKPYGTVTSTYFPTNDDGTTKGFAFVNMDTHENAQKAVDELHGTPMTHKLVVKGEDGEDKEIEKEKPLFVGRAMKKSERERLLKEKFDKKKMELINKYQGRNLYVRNLDESVTEDELREMFEKYGEVERVRVSRDEDGRSKLFGYVCFANKEDAQKAINEYTYSRDLLKGKPLYVNMWQPREVRHAQMQAQQQSRMAMGPMGMGGQPFMMHGMNPVMLRQMPMMNMQGTRNMVAAMPTGGRRGGGRNNNNNRRGQRGSGDRGGRGGGGDVGGFPQQNFAGHPMMNQMMMQMMMQQQAQAAQQQQQQGQGQGAPQQGAPQGMAMAGQQPPIPAGGAVPQPAGAAPPPQQQQQQQADQENFTQQLLRYPEQEQKELIGEKLYSQIVALTNNNPSSAKITGMLLDAIEVTDLLHLLESREELTGRIKEAMSVLETATHSGTATS